MKIIYLLCSPGFGVVDIWLPIVWRLKQNKDVRIILVFPEKSSLNLVQKESQLFKETERLTDGVIFMTYTGKWYATSSLLDSKKITAISNIDKVIFMLTDEMIYGRGSKIYGVPFIGRFIKKIFQNKVSIGNSKYGIRINKFNHFGEAFAILFDVTKEHKPVNADFLYFFKNIKKFSMQHGLGAACWISNNGEKYKCEDNKFLHKSDVKTYLSSYFEVDMYKKCYGIDNNNIKVSGIVRHDPLWKKFIINSDLAKQNNIEFDDFVLIISRPISPYNTKERMFDALCNVRDVICGDLGKRIVIKLHPKEDIGNNIFRIYEEVFGRDNLNKTWCYSALHPLYLASKCYFGISFYSGVPLDLLSFEKPTIEYLDLRGLNNYDNEKSLRDKDGHPVFSERFSGLVLGSSNLEQFRRHVFSLENNYNEVVEGLLLKYKEYFYQPKNSIDNIVEDIISC
jgi:hypothetical protein